MRTTGIMVLIGVVLALGGCAQAPRTPAAGSWREVPGSPLTARSVAVGLWTGGEVLLLGGQDGEPCPEGGDCPPDPTPLADGAAVDPATGAWRKVAAAPVGFAVAQGVVVAGVAYVAPAWPQGGDLLGYDIAKDRWDRLPGAGAESFSLVAAGDRLVMVRGSHEQGHLPDRLFDRAAGRWLDLPADPLGAGFDRSAVWTGRELVLFAKELVADPGRRPTLLRAAAFDFAAGTWRRLPDLPMIGSGPWLPAGDRLVNPTLGRADGGQVDPWDRAYPYGGILAPATGAFTDLPGAPPVGRRDEVAAGARSDSAALYPSDRGWLFDVARSSWVQLPRVPGGRAADRAVVAAGTRLFAYGGQRDGRYLTTAWLW